MEDTLLPLDPPQITIERTDSKNFKPCFLGTRRERYPYLALSSSKALASDHSTSHACGQFSKASQFLQSAFTVQILPKCTEPSLAAQTGTEPIHQRGYLQIVHSSYLDFTSNTIGHKDALLLGALPRDTRWHYRSPPIHTRKLDAFTPDSLGTASGWLSMTPTRDGPPFTTI